MVWKLRPYRYHERYMGLSILTSLVLYCFTNRMADIYIDSLPDSCTYVSSWGWLVFQNRSHCQ